MIAWEKIGEAWFAEGSLGRIRIVPIEPSRKAGRRYYRARLNGDVVGCFETVPRAKAAIEETIKLRAGS